MNTITFTKNILRLLVALSLTHPAFSQIKSIGSYTFANYPATVYNGKKAKIDYASCKTAQTYRTAITTAYKTGKINFGGHFIAAFWGCGSGCSQGVLIDVKSGNVYDLPWVLGENDQTTNYCSDNDGFIFYPDSKLFIGTACKISPVENGKYEIQKKYRFIYIWNEKAKHFQEQQKFTETITREVLN